MPRIITRECLPRRWYHRAKEGKHNR